MSANTRMMVFDVPPQPFTELPKIPACFCQYPMIYACTWDAGSKAWFWRFDMQCTIKGVPTHFSVPAPLGDYGRPHDISLDLFIGALQVFVKKLIEARGA